MAAQDPPDPALAALGQAGFSPFASLGTVVHVPAQPPPRPPGGDWATPLLVTALGLAGIASLVRRLLS